MRFHLSRAIDIAVGYRHRCERWIAERVRDPQVAVVAARLVAAIVAMPVALAFALLSTGFYHVGAPAMITAGAVLVALPMILCALAYLTAAPATTGLVALAIFGGGLTAASVLGAAASPFIWVMVAAMPIEAWFVLRSRRSILAGLMVAAAVLFALSFVGNAGAETSGNPVLAVLFSLGYAAYVAARAHEALGPVGEDRAERDELSAIETAVDGVVARLSPDGNIRAISTKSVGHFGVPRQMLVGTPLLERVHLSDRIQYLSMLADLRAGAESVIADIRLRRAGSDRQHVEYRTFRLEVGACRDAEGAIEGFAVVARDICDDLAAREALEQALEEAESVQISKSRFLASVSHELRTPLNSVIGFSDILLREMFGKFTDERQREYVELIQRSGTHLLSVVNAILDVSKLEAGSYSIMPEPFDFKEAAAMAHDMMSHQAGQKGITLVDRVDADGSEVVADRRAIQQILINLISNAIKFTHDGGVVTIDSVQNGSGLVFSVGDTGIGMSADDLKKLGRPFFQIHNDYTRAYEGTGLGVSLVKGLVELHGGTLDIASRPGEGTVVTVTIPQPGRSEGGIARRPAAEDGTARIVELSSKFVDQGVDFGEVRKTG